MESVINVQTDEEKMEKLFDKNDSYVIRFAAKQGENNYKIVVAHSDEIGSKAEILITKVFWKNLTSRLKKNQICLCRCRKI